MGDNGTRRGRIWKELIGCTVLAVGLSGTTRMIVWSLGNRFEVAASKQQSESPVAARALLKEKPASPLPLVEAKAEPAAKRELPVATTVANSKPAQAPAIPAKQPAEIARQSKAAEGRRAVLARVSCWGATSRETLDRSMRLGQEQDYMAMAGMELRGEIFEVAEGERFVRDDLVAGGADAVVVHRENSAERLWMSRSVLSE